MSKVNDITPKVNGRKLLSEFKFYSGNYSKYLNDLKRFETWEESVDRVMNMFKLKYQDKLPLLENHLNFATKQYKEKRVLASQRALQFAFADPNYGILKHNSKLYNCLSSYADRPQFFQEAMYWLLSGCGVGFRVFQKDVDNYKLLISRDKGVKTLVIEDSIEGWSDAFGILISSFISNQNTLYEQVPFKEYNGYRILFDYSLIREEGALISGGFKAPGHKGLKASLEKTEELLVKSLKENGELRTIDVYDIVMHMADAVLSGGVRRSATICLFDKTDNLMLNAKTGDWFKNNPQRARSNNSVLINKNTITKEEFDNIFKFIRDWGEPGFVLTEDTDITYNPCVEIGKYPQTEEGVSGWQGCNLTETNGAKCSTPEAFYNAVIAATIIGTLQAGFTDFDYVEKTSPAKSIFEREALLGVSITGFASNPEILFDKKVLKKAANIMKDVNKQIAAIIGINQAARIGCTKPSGNASVLLETPSGIHAEHSKRYFRNVQVNKQEELAQYIKESNPKAVEDSVYSAMNTDWVISFPVENNDNCIVKKDLDGIKLLEKVKLVQKYFVEASTNKHLCLNPHTRHNVSNTINVENWDETRDYIFENRKHFAGISLLGSFGDKDYAQAPFTEVKTSKEILEEYGEGSMFASGLIVDGLKAFNMDLWNACSYGMGVYNIESNNSENVLKLDWIRRFKKFAENYLQGDLVKTSYLLKDVHLYRKWIKINRSLKDIDWQSLNIKPRYTNVSETGALACSGGKCELIF